MAGGAQRSVRGARRYAAVLSLASGLGCSVYDPALIAEGNAYVPARPSDSTSSPDDSETLVFALKDIYIRQSTEMVGFRASSTQSSSKSTPTWRTAASFDALPPSVQIPVPAPASLD